MVVTVTCRIARPEMNRNGRPVTSKQRDFDIENG